MEGKIPSLRKEQIEGALRLEEHDGIPKEKHDRSINQGNDH